jgi:PAS domain S-box-containing protein
MAWKWISPSNQGKRGYVAAVSVTVFAALFRATTLQAIGMGTAYLTFYPAVMLASIFGGWRSGLLATVLSALLSLFWTELDGPLLFGFAVNIFLMLAVFICSGLLIAAMGEGIHRGLKREQENARQVLAMNEKTASLNQQLAQMNTALEQRVNERTSELKAANQEITDQLGRLMRSEMALEESESRYRSIIEQAPLSMVLFDPATGWIAEVNGRFTERFGYCVPSGDCLNLADLIEDTPGKLQDLLATLRQNGSLPMHRHLLRHQAGHLVHAEQSICLIRYHGREMAVSCMLDVSEEVRREQAIHRDAQMATRVQNAMLSKIDSSTFLSFAAIYHPYRYVGGDLYFLDWRYQNQVLRGFLIDAAGHGLGTALHTSAMHVLLREINELDLPIAEQVKWLNRQASDYFDEGTFAGALVFELDLQARQLRWVCAGIPSFWANTHKVSGQVSRPGMYLGIDTDELFETHTMPLEIGDCLYFVSDGIDDRLRECGPLPLQKFSAMIEHFDDLAEAGRYRDDATALCFCITGFPDILARQTSWPREIDFAGYGDYLRFKGELAEIIAEVTGKPHSLQEVAVNESLANALECRDGMPRQHRAKIKLNRIGKWFIVRVRSSRIGFAGNALLRRLRSQPDAMFAFGEDMGMGRGIPLMLSLSHKMTYNNEGTEVLLAWRM